jgi:hypothetical protein
MDFVRLVLPEVLHFCFDPAALDEERETDCPVLSFFPAPDGDEAVVIVAEFHLSFFRIFEIGKANTGMPWFDGADFFH